MVLPLLPIYIAKSFHAGSAVNFIMYTLSIIIINIYIFLTQRITSKNVFRIVQLIHEAWPSLVGLLFMFSTLKAGSIDTVKTFIIGSSVQYLLLANGLPLAVNWCKPTRIDEVRVRYPRAVIHGILIWGVSMITVTTLIGSLKPNYQAIATVSRLFAVLGLLSFLIWRNGLAKREYETVDEYKAYHSYLEGTNYWGNPIHYLMRNLGFILIIPILLYVGIVAEFIVDQFSNSLEGIGIGKTIVGFIVIPLVVNLPSLINSILSGLHEQYQALVIKNYLSSIESLLYIAPLAVLMGWILNQPMSFDVGLIPLVLLLMAIANIMFATSDRVMNLFEGWLLLGAYAMFCILVGFYL